jgi:hypothetical protein
MVLQADGRSATGQQVAETKKVLHRNAVVMLF